MNLIAWLTGLALLGTGLYRLWLDLERERARAQKAELAGRGAQPARPSTTKAATAAPAPTPTPSTNEDLGGDLDAHDDDDITLVTLAPVGLTLPAKSTSARTAAAETSGKAATETAPADSAATLFPPKDEEDEEYERASSPPAAVPIIYDEDASVDEPTRSAPWILVSAASQTDRGRKRRRNEDSVLALEDQHLFVVADGMGGHAGGDVASKMAVDIIETAFKSGDFGAAEPYPGVPVRGAELALAIQLANKAIFDHARSNAAYKGMGTTVVSARFSPNKQRVYFGHVGDSRCYRLRAGKLTQVTTDHTMAAEGITGPLANHLARAVGIHAAVKVDLIIARPLPDDVYLLCSDGLSKMVSDDRISTVLREQVDPTKAVGQLVDQANEAGGRDNITVVVVQVRDAAGIARLLEG